MIKDLKIKYIDLTITLSNGEKVQGFTALNEDRRWGNDREYLGACVSPMASMHSVLCDDDAFERED